MSAITTHVLDTSRGRPAAGVAVVLERASDGGWLRLGEGVTDADGRCRTLLPESLQAADGTYRLTFETGSYFRSEGIDTFFPHAQVTFEVRGSAQRCHVPLLVSPFGYTTYRGT